ncbi:MAG: hypothetical protein JNM48_10260 [Rhodospirillales bacterium]|nr:hypothetical protein [Rhodospirillales bacterium]
MNYDLISEEDYATLPVDDPERCFIAFEKIVRRNMLRLIDENSSGDYDQAVRHLYMTSVAAVASECKIQNVYLQVKSEKLFWEQFDEFCCAVQAAVARINIRIRISQPRYSVLLTANTRTTIEHYISRIRDVVNVSDLDPGRKKRIDEKLDQLATELRTPRLSFAKSMVLLAGVLAAMGNTVNIAADGRNAVAQIIQLIGRDKETEDAAAQRLTPPPKALPAPDPSKPPGPKLSRVPTNAPTIEFDDEIPF